MFYIYYVRNTAHYFLLVIILCPSSARFSILSLREYRSVSFSLHYLHRFIAIILDRAIEDKARKLVALPSARLRFLVRDICRLNK